MHRAPRLLEIVDEGKVELVCTGRVGVLARAKLLDKRDLVVDAERDQERDDDTRDEELVATDVRGGLPVVHHGIPLVVL